MPLPRRRPRPLPLQQNSEKPMAIDAIFGDGKSVDFDYKGKRYRIDCHYNSEDKEYFFNFYLVKSNPDRLKRIGYVTIFLSDYVKRYRQDKVRCQKILFNLFRAELFDRATWSEQKRRAIYLAFCAEVNLRATTLVRIRRQNLNFQESKLNMELDEPIKSVKPKREDQFGKRKFDL